MTFLGSEGGEGSIGEDADKWGFVFADAVAVIVVVVVVVVVRRAVLVVAAVLEATPSLAVVGCGGGGCSRDHRRSRFRLTRWLRKKIRRTLRTVFCNQVGLQLLRRRR